MAAGDAGSAGLDHELHEGAAGIRIYHARHADHSPTMVMVAVDEQGADLAGASSLFIQNSHDCPPYCAGSSLL